MKRTSLLLAVAVLLVSLGSPIQAGDETTMTGEYIWNRQDVPTTIKAVFTPSGDARWDVSFYFKFREESHVYSGTAEGSLSEGALKGEVRNENKKRTFIFSGEFADGVFNGTHAEMRDGKKRDTGTITFGS
ncbi:MAG: hypothetical protein AAF560_08660 [Acidobacteriota bacterium]